MDLDEKIEHYGFSVQTGGRMRRRRPDTTQERCLLRPSGAWYRNLFIRELPASGRPWAASRSVCRGGSLPSCVRQTIPAVSAALARRLRIALDETLRFGPERRTRGGIAGPVQRRCPGNRKRQTTEKARFREEATGGTEKRRSDPAEKRCASFEERPSGCGFPVRVSPPERRSYPAASEAPSFRPIVASQGLFARAIPDSPVLFWCCIIEHV
jgi:hypothetical protein